MPDPLKVTHDGGAVHAVLNRPDAGNAVDEAVLDALAALLGELRYRSDVRALTLSGAGDDFCLGGDRAELIRLAEQDPGGTALRRVADKAKYVCEALTALPAVTIARVHGRSIGAGVLLAVSCDLRVGTQDSSFRLPELALGMPTAWGGGLARLVAEVGIAKTREMVLIGDVVTADEARDLSILHRVTATPGDADKAVEAWIRPLLRRSETALRATKDLFNAYARAAVQGDVTTQDSMILSSVVTARHRPPTAHTTPIAPATPAAPTRADVPVAIGTFPPSTTDAAQPQDRQSRPPAWMPS
jgi:methylglutaconyl-CoA hydratase